MSPSLKDQSWHCGVTVPGIEGDACCLALLTPQFPDTVTSWREPFSRSHITGMEKEEVSLLCLHKDGLPLWMSREPWELVLLSSLLQTQGCYIKPLRGWRDGSDNSVCYFQSRLEFHPQHPHSGSQMSITPIPGVSMLSSGLFWH